ncbi:MAG: hypothetical protein JXC85_06460 [Candidatus Aenigmarchaeota archaeon]|nr:hypothetical protein [Candidatus Aenigmarchaeota archaeon]
MTGGEYFKLNLVYVGKGSDESDALNYDYLFHSGLQGVAGPQIERLDVTAGWVLSEIRKRKTYPKMLKKFQKKMTKQGFALLGKVIDEGKTGDDNFVGVWAPYRTPLPPGVQVVQQDPQVMMSPREDSDGVLGEYLLILLGQRAVNETWMTHGYSHGEGQFDIGRGSPLRKAYQPQDCL